MYTRRKITAIIEGNTKPDYATMTFSTDKFVEAALNQSWLSWCAVINYNSKTKNNREVSYFRLSKDTSVHKDWIHATGHPLDNLPSKIKSLRKFSNSYSQEQTEHVYCHSLSFFIIYFANFIYSELNCRTQAEVYLAPYQRFKMTLLAEIINNSRGVFTTESNI